MPSLRLKNYFQQSSLFCYFIPFSPLKLSRGESHFRMHTPQQITFGTTDLWPRPLRSNLMGQRFITTATMASRRVSEGAGLLQEEITHLSGAEIVMRMIRPRKYVPGKQRSHSFHITWLLPKGDLYQGRWHTLTSHKRLSEHFLELCGSLLILLLHPYLFIAPMSRLDLWVWHSE